MRSRRNLVVILAHGLRADTLGDDPTWPVTCPNFQKLTEMGLRLIACSASPADPAGMISLLTGLHVRQHGLDHRQAAHEHFRLTHGWARQLAEEGYRLAGAGRVGLIQSFLQEHVSVADVSALSSVSCDYLKHVDQQGLLGAIIGQRRQMLRQGPFVPDRLLLEPDDDVDGYIGLHASRMIERMPASEPWAVVASFTGPGNDLPPPSLYDDLLEPAKLTGGFAPADLSGLNGLIELDYPRSLIQRMDAYQVGRIRADYLGRVSLIDQAVGRMLRAISSRGDAGRTWLVIASDRGTLLGEKGLVGHRSFLSPVMETPVFIVPPLTGRVPDEPHWHDGLVSVVDVAATIAALGGCDLPEKTVGRSLLPLLQGQPTEPRASDGACLSEHGHRLMIETRRHRVIFNTQTSQPLAVHDLLCDPDETENLVATPSGLDQLDALRARTGQTLLPLSSVPTGMNLHT